ncbi:hypothetical protein BATDEDRAFT_87292 [Batrachochytrium dendrobatidis JAM81]|uniref:SCP domain-containing protein n=1 Tax=Batrachochytrium dendrobatidis (strain JAM81 / FGSC 10211) TaxID=684364 RepID=F4NXQ3_BATDJ|nr:uncharacterized protein BATDEDRAFT_87292 [Batrachochytrium dendrobatidis JAM81]EGF81888.1 hypothetical protein BATDEDRAFT_87292 [Batrachochytrium dendrobatidis JAM81]|eukprot:XP_006677564.1 hypothetical protein BATDEDRAFT_87292 [Batrachochytrium dendrobatidis JAM81]
MAVACATTFVFATPRSLGPKSGSAHQSAIGKRRGISVQRPSNRGLVHKRNDSSIKKVAKPLSKPVGAVKSSPKRQVQKKPSPKRQVQKKLSPKRQVQKKLSPKRQAQKKLSPKRQVQKKLSPKRQAQKKLSPKRQVQKKLSPKRQVQKKLSPKRQVQKKLSPKRQVRKSPSPRRRQVRKSPSPRRRRIQRVSSNLHTTGNSGMSGFEADCLNTHNQLRAVVGAPSLSWSRSAANAAQTWANHLASTGLFQHSGGAVGGFGESLYRSSHGQSCGVAVRAFFSERVYYHGGPISLQDLNNYGHYTQLVWASTRQVGCAQAGGNIVCEYFPPGNTIGQYTFR